MSIWIAVGQLQIAYRETLLAQYRCAYDRRQRRLHEVSHPTVYRTRFASPQLELIELDDAQWLKVQQRAFARRTPLKSAIEEQLAFAGFGISACICLYFQMGGNFFPHVSWVP